MLKGIIKVTIERAEGPTDHPTMRPRTFHGPNAERDGNAFLREISNSIDPKMLGYNKTDVNLVLSDEHGNEYPYEGRFDVKHWSHGIEEADIDIRRHVTAALTYYVAPEKIAWIAKDKKRLAQVRSSITEAERQEAQLYLDLLNANAEVTR